MSLGFLQFKNKMTADKYLLRLQWNKIWSWNEKGGGLTYEQSSFCVRQDMALPYFSPELGSSPQSANCEVSRNFSRDFQDRLNNSI